MIISFHAKQENSLSIKKNQFEVCLGFLLTHDMKKKSWKKSVYGSSENYFSKRMVTKSNIYYKLGSNHYMPSLISFKNLSGIIFLKQHGHTRHNLTRQCHMYEFFGKRFWCIDDKKWEEFNKVAAEIQIACAQNIFASYVWFFALHKLCHGKQRKRIR